MPIVTGISQVLVIVAGLTIFKEHISNFGIIGIFLVIAGIVMLNIKWILILLKTMSKNRKISKLLIQESWKEHFLLKIKE